MAYALTRKTAAASKTALADKGIEVTLQEFMDELEKSNLELIETVSRLQRDLERETEQNGAKIEELQKQVSALQGKIQELQQSDKQRESEDAGALFSLSGPYAQAAKLNQEGFTVTQIAKKLGMGKGEVELALRLSGSGGA